MPLSPLQPASAASRAESRRSHRRHGFLSERRSASPAIDDTPGQNTFDGFSPAEVRSSFRSTQHTSRLRRREWRSVELPKELRGRAAAAQMDIETELDEDGSIDVIDCEVIASRKELQRWRLSLTDFHALVTGGTESIAAWRQEQQRKEAAAKSAAPHQIDARAALAADEATLHALPAAAPADSPSDHRHHGHEATWRKVVMWPWRTLKHFWFKLLHWIG